MSSLTPILKLNQEAEIAVVWAMSQLKARGFLVERTFDLHAARMEHTNCPCPHHGTTKCNCQMVVLLIHGMDQQLVTLIVHGNDNQTCLSLVESANQPDGAKIMEALELEIENREI